MAYKINKKKKIEELTKKITSKEEYLGWHGIETNQRMVREAIIRGRRLKL
jgi:hypothetical protein